MKSNLIKLAVGLISIFALVACSPSASQLKKTLQENPEILHAAIEADPKGFFESVQKAQSTARESGMEEQIKEELTRVLKEIKEAKNPIALDEARAFKGNKGAKVTILEWADFKCGYCSKAHDTMKKLVADYGDKVVVQYKHLPILSEESRTAAEIMEAIALQDKEKALQFHDILFAKQNEFRTGGMELIKSIAKEVGADWAKAQKDAKGPKVKKIIEDDIKQAQEKGFSGTPGFLVNNGGVYGALPYEFFKQVVDAIEKGG